MDPMVVATLTPKLRSWFELSAAFWNAFGAARSNAFSIQLLIEYARFFERILP
jgi:hypothetical protein